MQEVVTPRALVAGVGNIFFGDDAFGVEVVRALSQARVPGGVGITDFGIRGLHLAYALLDAPELVILINAMARGGEPGTLYVMEPALDSLDASQFMTVPSAHAMDLSFSFTVLKAFGNAPPRVLIVGCEPQNVEEGIGLSPPVERAVGAAAELVLQTVRREFHPLKPLEQQYDSTRELFASGEY